MCVLACCVACGVRGRLGMLAASRWGEYCVRGWCVRVVCVRAHLLGPCLFWAKILGRWPFLGGLEDVSPLLRTSPQTRLIIAAHINFSRMPPRAAPTAITVTPEARLCAANAGVEDLISLMATYESRVTIDLRALCNLGHGSLKSHSDQTGTYAANLKTLDDHNVASDCGLCECYAAWGYHLHLGADRRGPRCGCNV